jgi:hypothetical protein
MAFGCVPAGREQIERERHARQEICRQPLRVDKRADLPIGSFAPRDGAISGVRKLPPASPATSERRLPTLRRLPSR